MNIGTYIHITASLLVFQAREWQSLDPRCLPNKFNTNTQSVSQLCVRESGTIAQYTYPTSLETLK